MTSGSSRLKHRLAMALRFHTKGRGPRHTLVPLNQIMDERYSVYLRRIDA